MKLPFLFSVPHGGTGIPDEVKDINILTLYDIIQDIDPFTQELYDFDDISDHIIKSDIARPYVDLNRKPDSLPPLCADGVIKNFTCFKRKIYTIDIEERPDLVSLLLNKYYYPWHDMLTKHLANNKIIACFDCHSMNHTAPIISPNAGQPRPAVCLANANGRSASFELIQKLKESFVECAGLSEDEIRINKPFNGGFITSHYGGKPLPWIQIEINRKLYLDHNNLPKKNNLNQKLKDVMENFFNKTT